MQRVVLFFDFEGHLGMPFVADYDLSVTTHRLLNMLDKFDIKAVFFVVGKIVETNPGLIKEIAGRGHEIALHGYTHEHLDNLTERDLVLLGENLLRTKNTLEKLIGKRSVGFRSPFLMSPTFHSPVLYRTLKKAGYKWVSNRSIRHEGEFLRPGMLRPIASLFLSINIMRVLTFILLNWRFILTDSVGAISQIRILANLRWLLGGMPPFLRNGLIEIPAHAPFDNELLGLPNPNEPTSNSLLNYAKETLIHNVRDARGAYNITFHDWIIGTNNRLGVLEEVLSVLSGVQNIKFVLPDELISRHD